MAQVTFLGGGVVTGTFEFEGYAVRTVLISPAEMRIRSPFPLPNLEEFRRRSLQAAASTLSLETRARAVVGFAQQGELNTVFLDLLPDARTLGALVTERRKYSDIDKDLAILITRRHGALKELESLGLPTTYTDLLETRLNSDSFRYRVAATCAVVLLAGILLAETEG